MVHDGQPIDVERLLWKIEHGISEEKAKAWRVRCNWATGADGVVGSSKRLGSSHYIIGFLRRVIL